MKEKPALRFPLHVRPGGGGPNVHDSGGMLVAVHLLAKWANLANTELARDDRPAPHEVARQHWERIDQTILGAYGHSATESQRLAVGGWCEVALRKAEYPELNAGEEDWDRWHAIIGAVTHMGNIRAAARAAALSENVE